LEVTSPFVDEGQEMRLLLEMTLISRGIACFSSTSETLLTLKIFKHILLEILEVHFSVFKRPLIAIFNT